MDSLMVSINEFIDGPSMNIFDGVHRREPREPGLESPASMENPWTNPGFLETQISAKSQGLNTSLSFLVKFLKFVARSSNVVALTFRCGFE